MRITDTTPFAASFGNSGIETANPSALRAGSSTSERVSPLADTLVRTNWARNQVSTPENLTQPTSVEELQGVVQRALSEKAFPLVVRGSMHSWSPVAVQSKGTAINIHGMIEEPVVDLAAGTVRVSAATQLKDLYNSLDAQGLTLQTKPTIEDVTVAGALATGTHGAARVGGLLSEQVSGVKLVDGRGRRIEIDSEGCFELDRSGNKKKLLIAGEEPLQAIKLHRGVLGAIYEVTLSTVPAFDLELVQTPQRVNEAFGTDYAKLKTFLDSNEHADFFWFVPDERVLMRRANRSGKPRKPRHPVSKVLIDGLIRTTLFTLTMKIMKVFPSIARGVGWFGAHSFIGKTVIRDRSDKVSTYLPGHAQSVSEIQAMEYGTPYDRYDEAMEIVKKVTADFPMPIPMYFRRVGEKLYFEFIWTRDFPEGKETAKRLESALVEAFGAGAIPHQGKLYFQNPWLRVPEQERESFMELKRELDPAGAFLNQYMKAYFEGKKDLSDSTATD